MDEHLTRDLFRAIHKGWRNPGDLAAIAMAHLFELCPRCRKEFESWRAELGEGVAAPEGQDFDAVFDRLRAPAAANDGDTTALEARVDAERKQARSRAEQLLALPAEQRIDWIRNERDKHSGLVLAEVLIEECRRKTPGYPHEGKALALLARVVLQHAPTSLYAVELYSLALARLANSLRVIGDLPRADQLLSDARYLLRVQGGGDGRARAEIDSLEGSLRVSQHRSQDAIPLLLRSMMTSNMNATDSGAEVACTIKLAKAHWRCGDSRRAIELATRLDRGLPSDHHLYFVNRKNWATYLCSLGRLQEAWEVFSEARTYLRKLDDPLERLRCSWTDAHILREYGRWGEAEEMLLEITAGFGAVSLRYDQALASLQLATWYFLEGRVNDCRVFLDEAIEIFDPLEVSARVAEARTLKSHLTAAKSFDVSWIRF